MSLLNSPKFPSAPAGLTGWPWNEEVSASIYSKNEYWPQISIVTPSFNQGEFIEETIRSVLLQNYPNLQFIVIDGGSSDATVSILQKYSAWIEHWVSEPDDGQPHAIQKGFDRATGEWLNWINSDDTLLPQGLFSLINLVSASTANLAIVAGQTINIRDGIPFGKYGVTLPKTAPSICFGLGINQPGSLLRRSAVESVNGVRSNLHSCMDLDLWLRILLRHGENCVGLTHVAIASYRYHQASKTCEVQDAFALEEFVVLTDLASAAQLKVAQSVSSVRSLSPIATLKFEFTTAPSAIEFEREYLRRLIVDDSLLYRALQRTGLTDQERNRQFTTILNQLDTRLSEYFPTQKSRIKMRALIRAQQSAGSFFLRLFWAAFWHCPRMSTLIEGLRLARLSFASPPPIKTTR